MKEGIIIFQKNAELGKVKTRLAATIGNQKALEAYQQLVAFTHKIISQSPTQKILFFSNKIEEDLTRYTSGYRFELQSGEGLGEKMSNSFRLLFEEKFERLVIIGTDCAEINPELISNAFKALNEQEVVIGPAHDGGYYLLGMRKFIPDLFKDISWSTDQVAIQTKEYLTANNLTFSILPTLSDVDLAEDWERFKDKLA